MIMPGVLMARASERERQRAGASRRRSSYQKPHCAADLAANVLWIGCRPLDCKASMVVTAMPSTYVSGR